MFRQFFTQKMGVEETGITILSDIASKADKTLLPTRSNIEREFQRLANTATKDDYVFILFAGHGTQVPESSEYLPNEADGMDSAFLPLDYEIGTVKNVIRDHEFGQWIHNIRQKGAFVWFVADYCHSGSGTRGASDETPRRLSLNLSPSAFENIENKENRKPMPGFIKPNVHFAAALPTQVTFSKKLPTTVPKEQRMDCGVLSYHICRTMESALVANRQLSYGDLIGAVKLQYKDVVFGGERPVPVAEGSDLSLALFSNQPVHNELLIRYSAESKYLNVGVANGFGNGSVFQIFDSAGQNRKPLGYIRIENESLFSSTAKLIDYDGAVKPASDSLPVKPLPCELIDAQLGIGNEIRVAFDIPNIKPLQKVTEYFAAQERDNTVFRFKEVKVQDKPDFIVQFADAENTKIQILAAGSPAAVLEFGGIWQPFDVDSEELLNRLRRLADVHCLLRIAERSALLSKTMQQAEDIGYLDINDLKQVSVSVSLFQTDKDISLPRSEEVRLARIEKDMKELDAELQRVEITSGNILAWVTKNIGKRKAWYNLVRFDSNAVYHSLLTEDDLPNVIVGNAAKSSPIYFEAAGENGEKPDSDLIVLIITADELQLAPEQDAQDNTVMLTQLLTQPVKTRGKATHGFYIVKVFSVITNPQLK
ncbi:hypothetical protein FACS189454_00050 [Planctomycetales bacterium]|nr:hypothetical protein FACS189454_00050 [Planctomycetales bacterium]